MPTIYSSDSNKTLGEFIRDVVDVNSNIVIPDLQRPYIWNPDQVILLVDSIFKKWPFGSLLCWNVKNHGSFIPHRPFWSSVTRNIKDIKSSELSFNKSATSYLMILDGQQRIQSLVLALGGSAFGFTLTDKEWKKVLEGVDDSIDPRYWSSGCLCLNIDNFLIEYENCNKKIAGMEVGKCLQWAVTYENSGLSHRDKKSVLPITNLNDGHYIRFSELWNLVEPSTTTQDDYIEILKKEFVEISEDRLQLFILPLAQFMQVIWDVKENTYITQLTVNEFDKTGIKDRIVYNNAIVNIFARLNTAGRALSPQEITLAWLKTGWRDAPDANNQSEYIDCASELDSLLSTLNDNSVNGESGMQMRMDNLVDILSFFWIIITKDGNNKNSLLLGNKDYVDGDIMRSIGTTTYQYWDIIKDVIVYCKEKFENRNLNECFSRSFNAFYVICCWQFIASLSYRQNEGRVRETQCKFISQINDSFDRFIDRWYFETLLSDTWSKTDSFATYISQLCILYSKIKNCNDPNQAIVLLNGLLSDLLQNLKQSSINRINSLRAFTRREVIAYKNLLWLWNRLSKDRYAETQKPMRRKSAAPKWEVDHSVPVAMWEAKVEKLYPHDSSIEKLTGQEISFYICGTLFTRSSLLSYINIMGNCSLLLRSHNRSKNDEPLGDFLESIYTNDQIKVIKKVLAVEDYLLYPNRYTIDNIIESVNSRTNKIKEELINYFNNGIQREDIV
jgi:hypothetical protein